MVRHVTEEVENTDIFVLSDAYKELGLWYEIYEQYPSDGNGLFYNALVVPIVTTNTFQTTSKSTRRQATWNVCPLTEKAP